MSVGASVVFNIREADELIAFYDNGHGPLSELPLWLQAMLFLVLSDFMLYWLHRLFHGGAFWKYHAIHHSSEELDWISAARFHPINLILGTISVDVILLMAGISPNIMLWVGPLNTFHSAFVHANLNWTLGPFRYVLATPVFLLLDLQGGWAVGLVPLGVAAALALAVPRIAALQAEATSPTARAREGRDQWGPFALLTGLLLARSILFYGLNTFIPLYWIGVFGQSPGAAGRRPPRRSPRPSIPGSWLRRRADAW